jgi:tellurite resistance protein
MEKNHARLLVRCMVAVASADGRLHPEEINVISEVFAKLTGHLLDQTLIRELYEIYRKEPLAIIDQGFVEECSPELKKLIVKACYLIKIADREVAPSEVDVLATIAAALDISEPELSRLIREVTPGANPLRE